MIDAISVIAADLGLNDMKDSLTDEIYSSAVIYTAASYWIKSSINDCSMNSPTGSHKHVIYAANQFINKMID